MSPTNKQAEEQKRDRTISPTERWKQMQDFLNWAEANLKPQQRRNRPRYRDRQGRVRYFDAPSK